MYEAGHPKPVLCDILEDWDRQGGETGSGGRGHMYANGQFMLVYGKNHHNFVIILQLKLKSGAQTEALCLGVL